MGFLDKAAAKVSEATKAAQEGIDKQQAKRKADGLLRELGAWTYAKHKGGFDEADANIARLLGELASHEAEFGELGAKDEPAPPPPPAPVATDPPPPPPPAPEPPAPPPAPDHRLPSRPPRRLRRCHRLPSRPPRHLRRPPPRRRHLRLRRHRATRCPRLRHPPRATP